MSKTFIINVVVIFGIIAGGMHFYNSTRLDYVARAIVYEGNSSVESTQECLNKFFEVNNSYPLNMEVCGLPTSNKFAASYKTGVITLDFSFEATDLETGGNRAVEGSLVFEPYIDSNNQLSWQCHGGSLPSDYRPSICRV